MVRFVTFSITFVTFFPSIVPSFCHFSHHVVFAGCWKQAHLAVKTEALQQHVYGLVELSKAVDKHDKMFMTFAKTFKLIPESINESMATGSPTKLAEGTPPSSRKR